MVGRLAVDLMRSFAETYPDPEFVQQVAAQLPWGHHLILPVALANRAAHGLDNDPAAAKSAHEVGDEVLAVIKGLSPVQP